MPRHLTPMILVVLATGCGRSETQVHSGLDCATIRSAAAGPDVDLADFDGPWELGAADGAPGIEDVLGTLTVTSGDWISDWELEEHDPVASDPDCPPSIAALRRAVDATLQIDAMASVSGSIAFMADPTDPTELTHWATGPMVDVTDMPGLADWVETHEATLGTDGALDKAELALTRADDGSPSYYLELVVKTGLDAFDTRTESVTGVASRD